VIFVDANVPMYLIGSDHPNKLEAQRVLARCVREQRRLVTSSEVFQELLHRFVAVRRRDRIEPAFELLRGLVEDVLSVDGVDMFTAKDVLYGHPQLSARDAVHVAVMRRREIEEILSFDRAFDTVGGIRRLPESLPAGA
jgi:predicted nucleic acid-binding protein